MNIYRLLVTVLFPNNPTTHKSRILIQAENKEEALQKTHSPEIESLRDWQYVYKVKYDVEELFMDSDIISV